MAATCLVAGYALTCDFKERRGTHLLVFIVCTMVFFSDRALAQWPLGYGAAGPISMSESALEEVAGIIYAWGLMALLNGIAFFGI